MGHDVRTERWPEDQEPTETALRRILNAEGLQPYRWSNVPGDVYAAHSHPYHKTIYVVQGSVTFGLPEHDEEVELQAGDRLELPPGVRHNAVVGSRGVVCLEAHR